MPLETTMLAIDTSEFMRNGDYSSSTRLGAIQDAANLVCNAKMQSNPENTVSWCVRTERLSPFDSFASAVVPETCAGGGHVYWRSQP